MEMESQRVTGFVPSFNVTKAAARNNNDDDDEERRNGAKEKRRRWMKWKRERERQVLWPQFYKARYLKGLGAGRLFIQSFLVWFFFLSFY